MITRINIEMTPDEDGIPQGYVVEPTPGGTGWNVFDCHEGARYRLDTRDSLRAAVEVALDEAIYTS